MSNDFGEVDYAKMSAIGHWERAIKRIQLGFRFELVRGLQGRIIGAKIYGDPLGVRFPGNSLRVTTLANFDEAYNRMEQLSIYYQIGLPTEKPIAPPPRWFVPEAQAFWEKASRRDVEKGNYVKRFGDIIQISYIAKDGSKRVESTQEQLIWVLAEADGRVRLGAFHYLDISSIEGRLEASAAEDWNRSMYFYIERQLLRPDIAKQKLAGLNHELHKAMLKAFFGKGSKGGVIKGGKGYGLVIEKGIKRVNKYVNEWYERWMLEK